MFPEDAVQAAADERPAGDGTVAENRLKDDEFVLGDSGDADVHRTLRIPYEDGNSAGKTDTGIPRVPADLLRTIKDDVIGVHSAESEAYYATMKLAAKVEQRKQLNPPRGSYALFMDSPAGSRGLAWRITGRLRRLSEVSGRTNSFGVTTVYDAWISTPDSGNELVHVVAINADKALVKSLKRAKDSTIDFPLKNPPEVRCTGYFFKREGYASGTTAGISRAPLLLAGTLHEIPVKVVTSTRADELTPYLGWLAAAVCIGVVFVVWSFTMSDAAHSRTRAHQLTKLPAHASFDDVSAVTVSEALGRMQTSESDAAVAQ